MKDVEVKFTFQEATWLLFLLTLIPSVEAPNADGSNKDLMDDIKNKILMGMTLPYGEQDG